MSSFARSWIREGEDEYNEMVQDLACAEIIDINKRTIENELEYEERKRTKTKNKNQNASWDDD